MRAKNEPSLFGMEMCMSRVKQLFCVLGLLLGVPGSLPSQRIITLAPALTEIVYSLGHGSQIVGNTRYCDWPLAARKIPKVGGLLDLDLEKVVALKPDLVILYPESQERLRPLLDRRKLLVVPHASLSDLYAGISAIARALGADHTGIELCRAIQNGLAVVSSRGKLVPKRSTLLIAGRESAQLRNLYLIGKGDFINEILDLAGGRNGYCGTLPYPLVSLESIVAMNPQCIVELSAYYEGIRESEVRSIWSHYCLIDAVREHRLFFVQETFWLRPGPRVVQIAEGFLKLLHPELNRLNHERIAE
jgi:iron complex transport system substrate-binding protein